jgi:hypothetical protein
VFVEKKERLGDGIVRLGKGTIKRTEEDINRAIERYQRLQGTIEFREVPTLQPWFKRIFGLGRPKLLLSKNCTFEVQPDSNQTDKIVYISPNVVAELLATLGNNQSQAILEGKEFDVTARKKKSYWFLLWHHPDATVKTTAWVILITTLFEILRVTFDGQASPEDPCDKFWLRHPQIWLRNYSAQ